MSVPSPSSLCLGLSLVHQVAMHGGLRTLQDELLSPTKQAWSGHTDPEKSHACRNASSQEGGEQQLSQDKMS